MKSDDKCLFLAKALSSFSKTAAVPWCVPEAHHNSKHQQIISGASILSFWLSSYAFDVMMYCIPLALSVLAIAWVDLSALVDDGALFACFVLLLGYGMSITSLTYAMSFLFDTHTKAQIITVLFNVFLGLVLMIAQFVMAQIDVTQPINECEEDPQTQHARDVLQEVVCASSRPY